jgi:hypothetical protein
VSPPKDSSVSPPKDSSVSPPKDSSVSPPKDSSVSPPKDAKPKEDKLKDAKPKDGKMKSGQPPMSMPEECKNPPKAFLTECCTIYPKYEQQKVQACVETCIAKAGEKKVEKKVKSDGKNSTESPSPTCCMADCILNTYGFLKDGAFDAETAKKSIAATTATDKAWTPAVSC